MKKKNNQKRKTKTTTLTTHTNEILKTNSFFVMLQKPLVICNFQALPEVAIQRCS